MPTATPRCALNPSQTRRLLHQLIAFVPRSQVIQIAIAQAKALNKAAYFFSVSDDNKVTHLNFVPKAEITKEFSAKTWIAAVSAIVGGKVRFSVHTLGVRPFY